ncbi:MAG: VOC family protein, partial [Actinomycetota bacterium]
VESALSDLFDGQTVPAPRAAFAEQLRARLEAELADTDQTDTTDKRTGTEMADQPDTAITPDTEAAPEGEVGPINVGSLFYATLPAADLDRSARFYSTLFGWDLDRGSSGYHISNVYPPMGLAGGGGGDPEVWIEVDDIEQAVAAVRSLGGTAEDPAHYDSGWSSACTDPQGVRFNLQVPTERYRQPARRSTSRGELFYWTLPAPQAAESKAFYNELFGWEFGNPGTSGGMHIENRLPDGGLGGGREGTTPDLFFRVDDLEAAMATVVELGGTAEPAGEGEEGRHAMCVDDQGVAFGISQPADGY